MPNKSFEFTHLPVLALTVMLAVSIASPLRAETVSTDEAKEIATDAYLYAYPMLYNYKTLFQQAVDPSFPGYVGGFNRFRHYSRGFTPADRDIVTPSNDTPYSWAWLDLRTEPMVVSVPASPDRYYVLQWFDLYTHNFAYLGSRATGTEAGHYLFAGPNWTGETPAGITKVLRAETEIIGTLTRTSWSGPADRDGLVAMQQQYRIRPLSEFAGGKPPPPAPTFQFPAWDEARANSIGFIDYLNFLLRFAPAVDSEKTMMERFAKIGIGPGRAFDPATIEPTTRAAIEAGIKDGASQAPGRTRQNDQFGRSLRHPCVSWLGLRHATGRRCRHRHLRELEGGGLLHGLQRGCEQAAARRQQALRPAILQGPGATGEVLLVNDHVQPAGSVARRQPDPALCNRQPDGGAQDQRRRLGRHLSAIGIPWRRQGVQLASDAAAGAILHGAQNVWAGG